MSQLSMVSGGSDTEHTANKSEAIQSQSNVCPRNAVTFNCSQYGIYSAGSAFDTPTQSATQMHVHTNTPLGFVLIGAAVKSDII